jgi:N-acetylneuraminic acid mutarotase
MLLICVMSWLAQTSTVQGRSAVITRARFDGSGNQTGSNRDDSASKQSFDITETDATSVWGVTGNRSLSRWLHTATLLPTGKVLIAGGGGDHGYLASAELYDPATGTWGASGSMSLARQSHTATLLSNGKVLIAGGRGMSGYLNSAELYDPATGIWTPTGSMNTSRSHHQAILLPNGQVLVAGGYGNTGFLNNVELYDPATQSWSTTASLNTARGEHSITLLQNGRVLVVGGFGTTGILNSAELYTPLTGTWSTTGGLNVARYYFTATLLQNGQVLVAGGSDGTSCFDVAEVYDQHTGTWRVTNKMNTARLLQTATLLESGEILVAGGYGTSGVAIDSAELYDPQTDSWTAAQSMHTARTYQTATLLGSGEVLVTGGFDQADHFTKSAELFNVPRVSIDDVSVEEGKDGTTDALFTVSLSKASVSPVSVDFNTSNETAIGGTDYIPTSGTLRFDAGQTSLSVAVKINGNTLTEGDRAFFLNVTNAINAFTGDAQGTCAIRDDDATLDGQVTVDGANLSGVSVNLSGPQTKTTATDQNGRYSFEGLQASDTYTITPSKTSHTFNPPSKVLINPRGRQTVDFTATLATHSISGFVLGDSVGLSGVTVTLNGASGFPPRVAVTGPDGGYSFTAVAASGDYTVTASPTAYYAFAESRTISVLSADQSSVNLTGTKRNYSISGQVTVSGSGLGGAIIKLSDDSGHEPRIISTDAGGNYRFDNVAAGGTYSLTPSNVSYNFSPQNQTIGSLDKDQTVNFVASLRPVLISEATSTRALALESVTWLREPFTTIRSLTFGSDVRTRVMFFALNLNLQPDEGASAITAEVEDAAHRRYPVAVEQVSKLQGFEWISCVVIRLSDDIKDAGDVLLRINYRDVSSNRVRFGLGYIGGGPADDVGAVPTPAIPPQ